MLHEDELAIDIGTVRALVDRDRPDLAAAPLRPLGASGSTNALFRLGADLLVRLPRQPGGPATIDLEARWLPHLATALPVPVPEIVLVGEPGFGYPERWSVVRWIEGDSPAAGGASVPALDLAAVVRALRELPVPAEALADGDLDSYRARPLSGFDAPMRQYLAQCRARPDLDLDLDACERVWDGALAAPVTAGPTHWVHGDLLAENLLVRDGRLAAVLDFGALAIGDPTVDLVVAWDVLDAAGREVFRSALDVDDATWRRGRAWALAIAVMTFPYYGRTMPARCAARLAMAHAVLADAR